MTYEDFIERLETIESLDQIPELLRFALETDLPVDDEVEYLIEGVEERLPDHFRLDQWLKDNGLFRLYISNGY